LIGFEINGRQKSTDNSFAGLRGILSETLGLLMERESEGRPIRQRCTLACAKVRTSDERMVCCETVRRLKREHFSQAMVAATEGNLSLR
jgi:hypothetical protein